MRSVLIIWNSRPHKSFELGSGELDSLIYRFALLRALGDHFADGALSEHLGAEARWCRIASKQGGHIAARWIIVQSACWRLFIFPSPEVAQLLEWRNVDAVTPGDELFNRGAGGQIRQEAFRRGCIGGKVPDTPKAETARVEAAPRTLRRMKRP